METTQDNDEHPSSSKKPKIELSASKDILLHLFEHGCQSLWKHLSPDLKNDRELVIAAVKSGYMDLADLDAPWINDKPFLLDLLRVVKDPEVRKAIWKSLPGVFQQDREFAMIFVDCIETVWEPFRKAPNFRGDRELWKKAFLTLYANSIYWDDDYFDRLLLPSKDLLSDRDFLVDTCCYYPIYYSRAKKSLRNDPSFFQICVEKNPSVLFFVGREAQFYFPQLILSSFPTFFRAATDQRLLDWVRIRLLPSFDPEFWQSAAARSAWFEAGGCFDQDTFHPYYTVCRELKFLTPDERRMMLSDVHCRNSIYSNLEMNLIAGTVTGLDEIEVFCVLALGGCLNSRYNGLNLRGSLQFKYFWDEQDFAILRSIYSRICRRTNENRTYMELFLCAICKGNPNESPLPLLSQGSETSLVFKRLIADYAGIATGETFIKYQRAKENLALSVEEQGGTEAAISIATRRMEAL